MKQSHPLAITAIASILTGCLHHIPTSNLSLYQRSMVINNSSDVERIIAHASIDRSSATQEIPLVVLRGTHYEMGFQHGHLFRKEVRAMYNKILPKALLYTTSEMLDEAWDLMEPYVDLQEKEEMRGLAHGANIPLSWVHRLHTIPSISEYGPKKKFRRFFKATSCSNVAAFGKATIDGALYAIRVLDWIRELGITEEDAVLLARQPLKGLSSVAVTYFGFIGTITGVNSRGMTFGEMGYGDPPGESLEGSPFPLLFNKLMREARSLDDVERIITQTRRTCSYVYVITDLNAMRDADKAAIFIADRQRVLRFEPGTLLHDEREDGDTYPPIPHIVYGGAKGDKLYQTLLRQHSSISPETFMELAKEVSLKSNMQNAIFRVARATEESTMRIEVWVTNASPDKGEKGKACNQQWRYKDLSAVLGHTMKANITQKGRGIP